MAIKFFRPYGRGSAAQQVLPIRVYQDGRFTLNANTVAVLGIEIGASAALGQDDTTGDWVLVYWPEGAAGQPDLSSVNNTRALTARNKYACQALLTTSEGASKSFHLDPEALTDPALPGALLYRLGPAVVAAKAPCECALEAA